MNPPLPPVAAWTGLRIVPIQSTVLQRMSALRESHRQRRLALAQRRLWLFYVEFNLFEQALECRRLMLVHLQAACQQLRRNLGTIC